MAVYNTSVFNDYTIKPRSISQYTSFRGVVDFSQIGKFNQFETGYSYLEVLEMPKYLTALAEDDPNGYGFIYDSFKTMLEYEFRGLTGLPDIDSEAYTISDGINDQQLINKVTMQTSVEVSMNYFERQGGLITKFAEHYLTGIKDKMTQAKTYHGLIKAGKMEPSPENEVFTLLYIVTDNTMLRVEKAVLLANAQLTRAETSMYDSSRGEISNVDKTISFRCFPITGNIVDAAAKSIVEDISGVSFDNPSNITPNTAHIESNMSGKAVLDSTNYRYGVIYGTGKGGIANADDEEVANAINAAASKNELSDSFYYNH